MNKTNEQLHCEKIILSTLLLMKSNGYVTQDQNRRIFEILNEK